MGKLFLFGNISCTSLEIFVQACKVSALDLAVKDNFAMKNIWKTCLFLTWHKGHKRQAVYCAKFTFLLAQNCKSPSNFKWKHSYPGNLSWLLSWMLGHHSGDQTSSAAFCFLKLPCVWLCAHCFHFFCELSVSVLSVVFFYQSADSDCEMFWQMSNRILKKTEHFSN